MFAKTEKTRTLFATVELFIPFAGTDGGSVSIFSLQDLLYVTSFVYVRSEGGRFDPKRRLACQLLRRR